MSDVTERDTGRWSESTTVITRARVEGSDVQLARLGRASFGGGGPRIGESVHDFVRRYGWRAYALPILVVVSVLALLTTHDSAPPKQASAASDRGGPAGAPVAGPTSGSRSGPSVGSSAAPIAPNTISLPSDAAAGAQRMQVQKGSALPPGPGFTTVGKGTFRTLTGSSKPVGSGPLYRYDIEVENGIVGVDTSQFASLVQSTLADPRSWSGHGYTLQRVDSGKVDFRISLTSSMTDRQYCGYEIHVETSCYAPASSAPGLAVNRVVLNVARWTRGATPYVPDLHSYRLYMINHEDGHALGHLHAHQCLPGGLAPVMMQQTFGLKSATDAAMCGANPWPYPPNVKGAPGAEQSDTLQNNEYYLGD